MDQPLLHHLTVATRVGPLLVSADDDGIASVVFADEPVCESEHVPSHLRDCSRQLEEYFAGKRRHFTDLPLHLHGTPFLTQVWEFLLQHVGFGEIVSYQGIAQAIGNPSAVRAVGSACKRNPFIIIVPCHRVLPSTLKLGTYAGGVMRKQWLLQHEEVECTERWIREALVRK